MSAAPTFLGYASTSWGPGNGVTSTRSVVVSVTAGDRIVVLGGTEDTGYTLGTPNDTVNSYTLAQSINLTSRCSVYAWTATAATSATLSIDITSNSNNASLGHAVYLFRDSDGFGTSTKANAATSAPSLAITTGQANSALLMICTDWNASDGTSRAYRTVNSLGPVEGTYYRDAAHWTVYGVYYSDAGTAASKTVGLTAPSAQNYSLIAVEIFGAATPALTPPDSPATPPMPGVVESITGAIMTA